VIEVDSNNAELKARLAEMLAPPVEGSVESAEGGGVQAAEGEQDIAIPLPGTCQ
jgi:hypothetical protein